MAVISCGLIKLPTSFGVVTLVEWFLISAELQLYNNINNTVSSKKPAVKIMSKDT